MKNQIKRYSHRLMRRPAINSALRVTLKPLARVLPGNALRRIPVLGRVDIRLRSGAVLYLESDGYDSIASRLYWYGLDGFESESLRVFQQLLPQVHTVMDVGANIGLYALIAAIEDESRLVFAFEPVPEVFSHLQRNITANHLQNVQPFQSAVCERDGDVAIYVPPTDFHLPVSASIDRDFQAETRTIIVEGITLDSFVDQHVITGVGLLKIDTESTEHLVLQGASSLLQRDRPMIICEVLPGRQGELLQRQLAEHNYRVFQISAHGVTPQESITGGETIHDRNFLFLPFEKIENALAVLS